MHSFIKKLMYVICLMIGLGLGLGVFAYLPSIRIRVFRDATLLSVGDLTNVPEKGTNITDQ